MSFIETLKSLSIEPVNMFFEFLNESWECDDPVVLQKLIDLQLFSAYVAVNLCMLPPGSVRNTTDELVQLTKAHCEEHPDSLTNLYDIKEYQVSGKIVNHELAEALYDILTPEEKQTNEELNDMSNKFINDIKIINDKLKQTTVELKERLTTEILANSHGIDSADIQRLLDKFQTSNDVLSMKKEYLELVEKHTTGTM